MSFKLMTSIAGIQRLQTCCKKAWPDKFVFKLLWLLLYDELEHVDPHYDVEGVFQRHVGIQKITGSFDPKTFDLKSDKTTRWT
jgi:hypothetical protein